MTKLLSIFLAGGLGCLARYGVTLGLAARLGPALPYGTFTVNVVGSGLMGLLFALASASPANGPTLAAVLGTGFLGGFTTFSAFSLDTLRLAQDGAPGRALAYAAATLLACLCATALGFGIGQRVWAS